MSKKLDVTHVASKLAARKVAKVAECAPEEKKAEDMPEEKSEDMPEEKSEGEGEEMPAEGLSDADFSAKAREMLGASDNEEALGLLASCMESLKSVQEQAEVSEEEQKAAEVESVVDEAMKAGRLTPAQRASAIELGKVSVKSLRTMLAQAPISLVARTTAHREVVSIERTQRAGVALTEQEIRHGKMAGLTTEQLLATKAKLEAKARK